jgi:hypothetical protein
MSALVLPFDRWPEADRKMWDALVFEGGVLDDVGKLPHLRLTTRKSHIAHYGRWRGLLNRGLPSALSEPPVQRFTQERVSEWLEDLSHTRPVSRHMFVNAALIVLKGDLLGTGFSRRWNFPSGGQETVDRRNFACLSLAY